jgi:uncharacterized membrane protein YuzA (DUF378 family)
MAAPSSQYGAFNEGKFDLPEREMPKKRRINVVTIAVALVVPWVIFVVVTASLAFGIHYCSASVAYSIVALCGVAVLAIGFSAFQQVKKSRQGNPNTPYSWHIFLFSTALVAFVLGCWRGNENYLSNMKMYHDYLTLNYYEAIDAQTTTGKETMDAGWIIFTEGTQLDLARAAGFKNDGMYCVVPIRSRDGPTYDFWAVGRNCCSGTSQDFHCGEYANPKAHSGMRSLSPTERPFYKLAVQQAQAQYGLEVNYPVFFHWVQNPDLVIDVYKANASAEFVYYISLYIGAQFIALVIAVCYIFKIGQT